MADRRRGNGGILRWWDLAFIVVGAALATASAWNIYETPRLIAVAAVGAVIGIGSALLVRLRRWQGWIAIPLAIAGFAIAVVPVAIPSAMTSPVAVLRGVRDGLAGIVLGWKQLLTLSLPLGEYQAVLVPFLVVIVAGTLVAALLVLADRFWSTLAAPVVIAMVVFGIVFGSSETAPPIAVGSFLLPAPRELLLGVLTVVVSVIWLVGRSRLQRANALRAARARTTTVRQGTQSVALAFRRQLAGVILVVVALGAGVAAAPVAQALEPRQALRDKVDPLLILRQQPSPLSAYRSWFEGDAYSADLFSVSGGTGVDRLRIATLDQYDGEEFRVSAGGEGVRFVRVPAGSPASGPTVQITIDDGYSAIWLPLPDGVTSAPAFGGSRAASLTDGFYLNTSADAAIDVALAAGGTRGLTPGDTYSVVAGSVDAAGGFESARGGDPSITKDKYPALAAWVDKQGVPRTGGGLADLIDRLRDRGYLSHALTESDGSADWIADLSKRSAYSFIDSYSGHSAARIEDLFTSLNDQQRRAGDAAKDADLVAAVGDDEQFAVAAALLARFEGFDSRVVLGVRLTSHDPDLGVAPCTDVCTGGNMTAWVEVRSPNGGWKSFDVTPQFQQSPVLITDGEKLPENPTVPDQQTSELLDPAQAQRDDSEAPDTTAPVDGGWLAALLPILRGVGLGALTLLFLLLPLLVLAFAKVFRRRERRSNPVPEVAMVGAWTELVSSYVDYGFQVPDRQTRSAVAAAVGRPKAVALAAVVDRAVFAEHPPGREASAATWQLFDEEARELKQGMPFGRRLRAAFTPKSFVREIGSVVGATARLLRRKGTR